LYDLYVYKSGICRDGVDVSLVDELACVFFSAICLDLEGFDVWLLALLMVVFCRPIEVESNQHNCSNDVAQLVVIGILSNALDLVIMFVSST
jgi:hypothetical protein